MPVDNLNNPSPLTGWRRSLTSPSLPEVFSSIPIPANARMWRKIFAFAGPGLMVAVGYMDPGNWATDLAGGGEFCLHVYFCHLHFEFYGDSFAVSFLKIRNCHQPRFGAGLPRSLQ